MSKNICSFAQLKVCTQIDKCTHGIIHNEIPDCKDVCPRNKDACCFNPLV